MTTPADLAPLFAQLEERLAARVAITFEPVVIAVQSLQANQRVLVDAVNSLQVGVSSLITRIGAVDADIVEIKARIGRLAQDNIQARTLDVDRFAAFERRLDAIEERLAPGK